jgi:hypothetical protein
MLKMPAFGFALLDLVSWPLRLWPLSFSWPAIPSRLYQNLHARSEYPASGARLAEDCNDRRLAERLKAMASDLL